MLVTWVKMLFNHFKLRANDCNNSRHSWANNVESCCVRVGSSVKTYATTANNVAPSRVFVKEIMCNACASPQQCCKSCANGSNIAALRLGDQGTKEMLGVVGSKGWPVSNFVQQLPTTFNRVCKQTQHVTSNNVATVCAGLSSDLTCMQSYCLRDAQRFT